MKNTELESHYERLFQSPTLEEVKMIERTIDKYSGEFNKTQIWKRLPRKVMWKTYLEILDYMEATHRTLTSNDGVITFIWNPKLAGLVNHRKVF